MNENMSGKIEQVLDCSASVLQFTITSPADWTILLVNRNGSHAESIFCTVDNIFESLLIMSTHQVDTPLGPVRVILYVSLQG